MNTLQDKQINNKIKQYGHVLWMDEDRIRTKVLKIKIRGKHPTGRPRSRWEQQVKGVITQKGGRSLEDTDEEEFWKDRDRWGDFVVWWPTCKWKCLGRIVKPEREKLSVIKRLHGCWYCFQCFRGAYCLHLQYAGWVCVWIYFKRQLISVDGLSFPNNTTAKCTSRHVRKYSTSSHHTLTEHKHGFQGKTCASVYTISVGMGKTSSLPVDHNEHVYAWWSSLNSKINFSTLLQIHNTVCMQYSKYLLNYSMQRYYVPWE